jgi:hypothetical protein
LRERKIEGNQFTRPPEAALRDRDRRANLDHDSITAYLCGDPKPGYSALDRQRVLATLPKPPKISAMVRG